jgi:hypothetical protein
MSQKIIYDKILLQNNILRDCATLISNYDKLTRDTNIEFICNCGTNYIKRFRYINEVGAKCLECTNINKTKKRKKTNLNIYGVEHAIQNETIQEKVRETMIKNFGVAYSLQSPEIMEKAKQTMINNYGVEHALQSPELKEKATNTIIERYGVTNVSHLSEIREKVKQTSLERFGAECCLLNPEVKEKSNKTMLEKYNVEHPSYSEEIKDKAKNTCLERYNVEHPLQSEEIKNKAKNTCIERYGVEYVSQAQEFKDKFKKTCLEKYGVEHISQSQEIQEKIQKNAKKYKEYIMPSGVIRKVQGYESFALNELVKSYEESDIITDRKDIPRIGYKIDDKQKYYFPDIYIKSINKIIEVKSTWTYECKEDNIQEKANATKLKGYEYEIWVYDSKGNKTIQ